jgi:hypothetical protein
VAASTHNQAASALLFLYREALGMDVERPGRHLQVARDQHDQDLELGAGWVALPFALERKYPYAGREWAWQ